VCIFGWRKHFLPLLLALGDPGLKAAGAFGLFTQALRFPCAGVFEASGNPAARAATFGELVGMGREDMLRHSLEMHAICLKRSSALPDCVATDFVPVIRGTREIPAKGKGVNERFGRINSFYILMGK
jgi:hypothetical protein